MLKWGQAYCYRKQKGHTVLLSSLYLFRGNKKILYILLAKNWQCMGESFQSSVVSEKLKLLQVYLNEI